MKNKTVEDLKPSWHAVDLIYIRVVAPEAVLVRFRHWMQLNNITFHHSETRRATEHAGYYRSKYNHQIRLWLAKNVGQCVGD